MKFLSLGGIMLAAVISLGAQTLQPLVYFGGKNKEYPESITKDAAGNLYLSLTFSQMVKKVSPAGIATDFARVPDSWLLGITMDPSGNVVVAGTSGLWKISPAGQVWLFAKVPGHISLNDMVYDRNGNLLVTDDNLFVIWKVDANGQAVVWSQDSNYVVTNETFPIPVGCNGIALSPDQKTLYVTNTSNGLLLALDIRADGSAGPIRVVASSSQLIGADGIKADSAGNVFVAGNINRQILKVDKFGGITVLADGGLLSFPTALVEGPAPNSFYVCNNGDAFFSHKPEGQGVLLLRQ